MAFEDITAPSYPENQKPKADRIREWAEANGLIEGQDFLVISEEKEAPAKTGGKIDLRTLVSRCLKRLKGLAHATMRGFQTPHWIDLTAVTFILILSGIFYIKFAPAISVEYQRDTDGFIKSELPITIPTNHNLMIVKFDVKIPLFQPKLWSVRGDDCITKFLIDRREVDLKLFGECDPFNDKIVPLGAMLTRGTHSVEVHIKDDRGAQGFNIRISPLDPVYLAFEAFVLIMISIWTYLFWKVLKLKNRWIFGIFLAGLLLRIIYFNASPYWVRTNDFWGHLDYIRYIFDRGTIPSGSEGWEFSQPPLYYAVSAVSGWIGKAVFGTENAMIWMIQFQSLLASVAVLGIAAWIGFSIFPRDRHRKGIYLFYALVAAWPTLIMSSSKINNDIFFQLFAFLAIGFIIRFWQTGSRFMWYGIIVAIILGVLSKLNMLLLLPPAFVCLLFSRKINFEQKLMLGGIGVLSFLALTEWFYVLRYIGENATFPVANVGGLSGGLAVGNSVSNYLGFHPLRYIRSEYLNPFDDVSGRQYFFEYFFKSSVYGEFVYGKGTGARYLARVLNGSTLLIYLLAALGIVRSLVKGDRLKFTFPLLSVLVFTVFGHLIFRYKAPYSCSQDFRYSITALVPIIYYVVTGAGALPKLLRYPVKAWLWIFTGLCVIFILLIPILQLY